MRWVWHTAAVAGDAAMHRLPACLARSRSHTPAPHATDPRSATKQLLSLDTPYLEAYLIRAGGLLGAAAGGAAVGPLSASQVRRVAAGGRGTWQAAAFAGVAARHGGSAHRNTARVPAASRCSSRARPPTNPPTAAGGARRGAGPLLHLAPRVRQGGAGGRWGRSHHASLLLRNGCGCECGCECACGKAACHRFAAAGRLTRPAPLPPRHSPLHTPPPAGLRAAGRPRLRPRRAGGVAAAARGGVSSGGAAGGWPRAAFRRLANNLKAAALRCRRALSVRPRPRRPTIHLLPACLCLSTGQVLRRRRAAGSPRGQGGGGAPAGSPGRRARRGRCGGGWRRVGAWWAHG